MRLIESKTLGTAQAAIEFTSIPQTFTDLIVLCSLRSSRTPSSDGSHIALTFNGATANYSFRHLRGTGSAASSFTEAGGQINLYSQTTSSADTANTFSSNLLYIPNYAANTTKSLSVDSVYENNATTAGQHLVAGLWNDTAAITSIRFLEGTSNNWVAGSMISLYGILKGTDGIVTTSP